MTSNLFFYFKLLSDLNNNKTFSDDIDLNEVYTTIET